RGREWASRGSGSPVGVGGPQHPPHGGPRTPTPTTRRFSTSFSNAFLLSPTHPSDSYSPRIATPSHRYSHLTFSLLQNDRRIDYSAAEVIRADRCRLRGFSPPLPRPCSSPPFR